MATLPCENGGGSLNNPNGSSAQIGTNNTALKPYVPAPVPVGSWEISSLDPDNCANADQKRQEQYVAETLSIAGAPINLFKLLGVHEQGNGSVLSQGKLISSTAYPGFPLTGVNGSGSWKTFQTGSAIPGSGAYIGVDFGIKVLSNGQTMYEPKKPKWTKVAAIAITQANTPNEFAKQVKVEINEGDCEVLTPVFSGVGNGVLSITSQGSNITQGVVNAVAISPSQFTVSDVDGSYLGMATVGLPFFSVAINFTINGGISPFAVGDTFSIGIIYNWKRVGIYNLIQSPLAQTINLQTARNVKAIRVTPTMFTGTGSWEVLGFDVLDSAPTDVNNIQDLFFNENRDRDYSLEPILLKAQYSPSDSMSELAKFGLNILDQYTFTISFAAMVNALGRPIVVGDIVEVIPEMQYDHNLKPIRKFLEVTDTAWASEGFSTAWKPMVYRFSAQQALPSQETRDIFGTLDTQKYLIADETYQGTLGGLGKQLDTTPLTQSEEIGKDAANAVPEIGSDDQRPTIEAVLPIPMPPANPKGQPQPTPFNGKQGIYIEDGLPKSGEPYGEGYQLPDITGVHDGDYFRLYYPPETKIAPRLFRFSLVKNRWIYLETDRRGDYSSHKPSVRSILQSSTKQGLGKKST